MSTNDEESGLVKTRIARDLQQKMTGTEPMRVIVEFNAAFPGGETVARALLIRSLLTDEDARDIASRTSHVLQPLLGDAELVTDIKPISPGQIEVFNSFLTDRYLFATLTKEQILVLSDCVASVPRLSLSGSKSDTRETVRLVHRIWLDSPLDTMVFVSSRTIKCDAARAAFNSAGKGIVWAVADTGIDGMHPHFKRHRTFDLPGGLRHWDFTEGHNDDPVRSEANALTDTAGHGTHVAGIIAGETTLGEKLSDGTFVTELKIRPLTRDQQPEFEPQDDLDKIAGIAPQCKIMSLKVLKGETKNDGQTSRLLAAIGYIQLINGNGRHIKVHGLNISLGYPVDIKSYGAGQSPLCSEVDRLVKSGVVVVVAAGNGGSGEQRADDGYVRTTFPSSITDPGNAELAITVGSTHRERPHTFGVSFFSAKGPTADGRMKPDLVAPGELIVSCALPTTPGGYNSRVALFCEQNGTSMAAPHVSGAVAAFLSVRREFQGKPERVKRLFVENATSLGRNPEFQGAGLIDLMRTLQAI